MQRVPHHFALPIYQDRLAQQFFRKMARLSFRDAMKFHKHMAVLTGTPKSLTIVTSLKGIDPNEQEQREILRDLVERLRIGDFLSEKTKQIGNDAAIVLNWIDRSDGSEGPLANARVMDLTEYGRVVHAEMLAICESARLGRSVKGSVLYCTTFPCHNCTKHILAAGISKVVFLEPYPKSQAKKLHGDEIQIKSEIDRKVAFMPFLGISPYRYRDLFAKGRRKTSSGQADKWFRGEPKPMLDVVFPSYPQNEAWALATLVGSITRAETDGPTDATHKEGSA